MPKIIRIILATLVLVGVQFAISPSQPQASACIGQSNNNSLFTIPPWHKYLQCNGDQIENPSVQDAEGNLDLTAANNLWLIAAALLEALLRISGIAAVFLVIFGGFKYITSQGSSDGTASARRTIQYAVTGMVITILASVGVSLFMNVLVGTGGGGTGLPQIQTDGVIPRVLNFIYAAAGVVAAVYVAIGGIKYTTSSGDASKTMSARNTIIYALAGLVIVLLAYSITGAVLNRL